MASFTARCHRAKFIVEPIYPAFISPEDTQTDRQQESSETLSRYVTYMQHVATFEPDNRRVVPMFDILWHEAVCNKRKEEVSVCTTVWTCDCHLSVLHDCFFQPVLSAVARCLLQPSLLIWTPGDPLEPWVGVWAAIAPSPRTPQTSAAESANSALRVTSATFWWTRSGSTSTQPPRRNSWLYRESTALLRRISWSIGTVSGGLRR